MKNFILLLPFFLISGLSQADSIEIDANQFSLNPTFSDVDEFEFTLEIAAPLAPGTAYLDPAMIQVDYVVMGILIETPSGFPSFRLVRSIVGDALYSQGSSLSFEIKADADLTDGLQVSELAGTDPVFELNAREVDTGRYHPPILQLNANGTGIIQNSNNQGGINPVTEMEVDVDFGEEYVTLLSFDPNALTLFYPKPEVVHRDGFEWEE